MKSVEEIIGSVIAEFAVDEPGTDEWQDYVHAVEEIVRELAANGYTIVRK